MSRKFLYFDSTTGFQTEDDAFIIDDHVSASTGVSDAGKPIILDATGLIDPSMINQSDIDHGNLSGLADDDHTQYILADGTRAFSGDQSMGGFNLTNLANGTISHHAVNLSQLLAVEELIKKFEWQPSVLDADILDPSALTPVLGDRYLINGVGAGAWVGQDYNIAEYNGTSWDFIVPTLGTFVSADDESDRLYYFNGSTWSVKYFEATTASNGLVKVGFDIQIDPNAAGAGLSFATGVLSVNVDNSTIEIDVDTLRVKDLGITAAKINADVAGDGLSKNGTTGALDVNVDNATIEIDTDILRVKADGINDTHIDFGVGANQVNAEDLPIIDTAGVFDSSNVEDALKELYDSIVATGVEYTVGAGGVNAGDLVYISSNDTVSIKPLNDANYAVGIALETKASGEIVKVLANDTVVPNILTGATAGARYYWNGTAHVTSIPTGAGAYIWTSGVAKNATDLAVEVEFEKRNKP